MKSGRKKQGEGNHEETRTAGPSTPRATATCSGRDDSNCRDDGNLRIRFLGELKMPVLTHEQLLSELEAEARFAPSAEELMLQVVRRLRDNLPAYNWVGFYMIEETPGEEPMLVLGPFVGADTPHKRIPLNQGICGAAASTGETVIVDDVNSDPRYLACSIETRSEIVVRFR